MDKTDVTGNTCLKIEIFSEPEVVSYFYPVFQSGFFFQCHVGTSIEDLLLCQLDLNRAFVEEKVNTVFLDGKCVDDISSASLKEGAVAAFSSALPGLAGATLRRGGAYACLRDSITHQRENRTEGRRGGLITVKLFNLLMAELGKVFLEKSIVLNKSAFLYILKTMNECLWRHVNEIRVREMPVSNKNLLEKILLADCDRIMVRVVIENKPCTEGCSEI
jgi:hypothetical protein